MSIPRKTRSYYKRLRRIEELLFQFELLVYSMDDDGDWKAFGLKMIILFGALMAHFDDYPDNPYLKEESA